MTLGPYVQGEADLVDLQAHYIEEKQAGVTHNVTSVLYAAETGYEDAELQLLDALDSKYDALRDKLLLEALITQVSYCSFLHASRENPNIYSDIMS